MKKFSKLFLSCAAVAALTAAVATSAMAAGEITGQVTGDYADGKMTIDVPADIKSGTEATLLVFASDVTTVTQDDITGIDQATGAAFTNTGLKGAPTADAKKAYTVKLGYTNKDDEFVTKTGTLFAQGEEIVVGDVNFDGKVIAQDASMVLMKSVGLTEGTGHAGDIYVIDGKDIPIGDVNFDGKLIAQDASMVLMKSVGLTEGTGHAGEKVLAAAK